MRNRRSISSSGVHVGKKNDYIFSGESKRNHHLEEFILVFSKKNSGNERERENHTIIK